MKPKPLDAPPRSWRAMLAASGLPKRSASSCNCASVSDWRGFLRRFLSCRPGNRSPFIPIAQAGDGVVPPFVGVARLGLVDRMRLRDAAVLLGHLGKPLIVHIEHGQLVLGEIFGPAKAVAGAYAFTQIG